MTASQAIPQGYPVSQESAAHLLLFGKARFIPEIRPTSKPAGFLCIYGLQILCLTEGS
jgi:hypothetical protein